MTNKSSSTDKLALLKMKVDAFSQERDWEKFHTLKNLSMALTIEAAELMEVFQWQNTPEESQDILKNKRSAIEQEVADIFIYLLRFCSVSKIDLMAAAEKKLQHNAEKYPTELVRGQSKKYTEY